MYLRRWLRHAAHPPAGGGGEKGWVTEEEVTDYFAIGQCTPGIIAVNTSVFIGHRQRGVPGGIAAALGVVFPSFVVITIIAAFLTKFATYPVVQHALAGINAAVVALIAVSVLKLGKTNLRGRPAVCIFLGVLVLGELSGLRPASTALIAAAGLSVAYSVFTASDALSPNSFPAIQWTAVVLTLAMFAAMKWTPLKKLHPIAFIAAGAAAGILLQL